LKIAAEILKWKKIPDDITLVIVPASSEIYKKALKEWLIDIFISAGALVESPNCAKCFGKHMWVTGPDSRVISSSNRNYKWRMGSEKSLIFLASPATVAASCLEWKITDPRKYF
jgi:3-isopropylmalate/(R)-2-methylmalate dehydratase large subunit